MREVVLRLIGSIESFCSLNFISWSKISHRLIIKVELIRTYWLMKISHPLWLILHCIQWRNSCLVTLIGCPQSILYLNWVIVEIKSNGRWFGSLACLESALLQGQWRSGLSIGRISASFIKYGVTHLMLRIFDSLVFNSTAVNWSISCRPPSLLELLLLADVTDHVGELVVCTRLIWCNI